MPRKFIIEQLDKPTRLDRVLKNVLPNVGRKAINQLIQTNQVQLNGKPIRLNSWKVHNGDIIVLNAVPEELPQAHYEFDESWIISADEDLIVINKPAGLLSHQTRYGNQPDLLSMARAHFGPVTLFHRLDRDTSGVVLLTKGKAINRYLDNAFKNRSVKKHYIALVHAPNALKDNGTINLRLDQHPRHDNRIVVVKQGGQPAITEYQTGTLSSNKQLVYLSPKTGRTHQLRVHLAYYDAYILGDRLYSDNPAEFDRLYLHAYQITLPEAAPFAEQTFTAPLPWDDLA